MHDPIPLGPALPGALTTAEIDAFHLADDAAGSVLAAARYC